jgi:hypothetical protein
VGIDNVHERALPAGGPLAEALIDRLAGPDDRLWPHDRWPAMHLDRGVSVGSEGGHGPIHYRVLEHQPGHLIRFAFTAPEGLIGEHSYQLDSGGERPVLRHTLHVRPAGRMRWQWPLLFEPLHDALIEDSFDRAVAAVSETPYEPRQWPPLARTLRWLLKGLM